MKPRIIIQEIICSLLVILFVYTGSSKLLDYEKFRFELGRSPFLQGLAPFIAWALPIGELIIALLIIIKRTRLLGTSMSFFLMALFTGYIWMMLHDAHDLPCSCGGVLATMSWNDHLVFNAVFTVLALVAMLIQGRIDASGKKELARSARNAGS
jgi:uncharacterized membrane protein YphA (DoxX/SURF4 family)